MGCNVMVTNLRAEHGIGKWKYSKGIFKIVKKNGNNKVRNNILPFCLMLHIAKSLLYFHLFG